MSENSDVVEKADPASPKLLPAPGSSENQATASPRSSSSADQHQSPRSPFLHNLHHRLRKGSVASSSAHSSEAGTPTTSDSVDKEEAARTARRFLLATIRNDWEWPPSSTQEEEDGILKEETQKKNELLSSREPVAWRTREEGPSDVDSDGSFNGRRRRRSSDPYKFENPDAVAASILEKKTKRKRKIEDEMQWNGGLKLWSERRDAWTGAVRTKPPQKSLDEERPPSNGDIEPPKKRTLSITQIIGRNSVASKMSENSASTAGDENEGTAAHPPPPPQQTSSSATNSPSVSSFPHSTSTVASTLDPDPNAPYLPVYPPLFPTSHTLRARIKPPAYSTIYSKVVVQSLTPNVPIPLTHMIGALVDGWKAEGNWPPQAAAQEAAAALRQKRNSRNEGAFAKWRHDQEEKRRLKRVSAGSEAGTHGHGFLKDLIPVEEGEVERKGFRRSLTGAVRKVFGMHEGDHDSDGGLERMGVRFVDEQELDEESEEMAGVQGLMKEARDAMDDNIVLNRALVEENS